MVLLIYLALHSSIECLLCVQPFCFAFWLETLLAWLQRLIVSSASYETLKTLCNCASVFFHETFLVATHTNSSFLSALLVYCLSMKWVYILLFYCCDIIPNKKQIKEGKNWFIVAHSWRVQSMKAGKAWQWEATCSHLHGSCSREGWLRILSLLSPFPLFIFNSVFQQMGWFHYTQLCLTFLVKQA